MDFVWIFYTCFLNIVGIRVSRTSSLANHRGKLAFLIMVNTFGFIQKIAIIYHLKKYFMFSSCDRIEGFLLDHVMYIMLYGVPCKTLHRKRENCVCTQYRMCLIKGWMLYFVCDPLLCMLSQVCVNEQGYRV